MLCQNCERNEANVKYTQIINGEKKQMVLCEKCAKKLGIGNFKVSVPAHFSNFLGEFFDNSNLLPDFVNEKDDMFEGENFITNELLNCLESCNSMESTINSALRGIYGKENAPKKTLNIEEKLKNIGENKSKNKTENKEEKAKRLQEELELAVKEERYEDAAKLRDEIKKLN